MFFVQHKYICKPKRGNVWKKTHISSACPFSVVSYLK